MGEGAFVAVESDGAGHCGACEGASGAGAEAAPAVEKEGHCDGAEDGGGGGVGDGERSNAGGAWGGGGGASTLPIGVHTRGLEGGSSAAKADTEATATSSTGAAGAVPNMHGGADLARR